jgi:hypothetical protein
MRNWIFVLSFLITFVPCAVWAGSEADSKCLEEFFEFEEDDYIPLTPEETRQSVSLCQCFVRKQESIGFVDSFVAEITGIPSDELTPSQAEILEKYNIAKFFDECLKEVTGRSSHEYP